MSKAIDQEVFDAVDQGGDVEEPVPEEEEDEEDYPDNTLNRDEIINSQPKDYNEWIDGENSIR